MAKRKDPLNDEELGTMRERYKLAEEADAPNRTEALEALRFYFGEQWEAEIWQARKGDGRPCFTLNKIPAIVKQILNEARENAPAIQINPVSDGSDEDTAEALQGLYRHVEANSDAPIAYESAFFYLVIGGFGSWRVETDYLPKSFDQDAFITPITNPFSVLWDPASVKPDKSDARFCFVTYDYSHDVYSEKWPDSDFSGVGDFTGIGNQAPGWGSKNHCRVVEYFTVEVEETELVRLTDGRTVWWDEMNEKRDRIATIAGKPASRKAERRRAYCAISNGAEWLEEKDELPIDDIPIVTIYGDQVMLDGVRRVRGMVNDLKEAQRLFNYNSSAIGETMALGSKSNWLATVEQIGEFMELWRQSNSRNIPVLPYKNVPGTAPPARISAEPPIEAMSAARMQSSDDLRSISGVYDQTQAPSGVTEESGKAILARRRQSLTGNSNFTANWAQGVKRTAKILLKFFPQIYDTARVVRITGSDQQPTSVMVHSAQPETVPQMLPPGVKGVFDLSTGTYDVTVSVGASDETKRQEAVNMLLTMIAANPALAPIIGDLVVQEMDFAGKAAIVERLQKALPPNLQDNQNPTDPQALAAHNMQLMQQNQGLMQQVQKLTQMAQTQAIQSASREKVEEMKVQSQQYLAGSRLEQERIKAQADLLKHASDKQLQIVHEHALAQRQEDHEHALATQGQVHTMMNSTAGPAAPAPLPAPGEVMP